jgi:hypothetical protein
MVETARRVVWWAPRVMPDVAWDAADLTRPTVLVLGG